MLEFQTRLSIIFCDKTILTSTIWTSRPLYTLVARSLPVFPDVCANFSHSFISNVSVRSSSFEKSYTSTNQLVLSVKRAVFVGVKFARFTAQITYKFMRTLCASILRIALRVWALNGFCYVSVRLNGAVVGGGAYNKNAGGNAARIDHAKILGKRKPPIEQAHNVFSIKCSGKKKKKAAYKNRDKRVRIHFFLRKRPSSRAIPSTIPSRPRP